MAVDNPYTGGVSSLGDLARHRSLARNMRIAAKEAADSRRQAYNVNSASEPMWETQARLRDRMMWESAKYLSGKDGDKLSKKALDNELTVVRTQAGLLQDTINDYALRWKRGQIATKDIHAEEPTTVAHGRDLYSIASLAMARLFRSPQRAADGKAFSEKATNDPVRSVVEAEKKPTQGKTAFTPSEQPSLGGSIPGLQPKEKASPKTTTAQAVPPGTYLAGLFNNWAAGGAQSGDLSLDLTDLFSHGLDYSQQALYQDPAKRSSVKGFVADVLTAGRYQHQNASKQPFKVPIKQMLFDKKTGTITYVTRLNHKTYKVTVPYDDSRMQWLPNGSVKVYPTAGEKKIALSIGESANTVSDELNATR